ncbi:hypothetical protein KAR91_61175 [Candidatus Pacearchaeota archaeon]|nr:hypothetical protein [Candidatus Pacearchaeota archaeon]
MADVVAIAESNIGKTAKGEELPAFSGSESTACLEGVYMNVGDLSHSL